MKIKILSCLLLCSITVLFFCSCSEESSDKNSNSEEYSVSSLQQSKVTAPTEAESKVTTKITTAKVTTTTTQTTTTATTQNKTAENWMKLYNIINTSNTYLTDTKNYIFAVDGDYNSGYCYLDVKESIKSANLLKKELKKALDVCGNNPDFFEIKSIINNMCSELNNVPKDTIESFTDTTWIDCYEKMVNIIYPVSNEFSDVCTILAVQGYEIAYY